jgi:hypothetical protein
VPATRQPHATVRYYLFTGGCATYRLSVTPQTTPVLSARPASSWASTPRWIYVKAIRRDQGLTLYCAQAPPRPG